MFRLLRLAEAAGWPGPLYSRGCPPLARESHSERLRVSSSASLLPCPQADGCFTNYFIITSYRHIHYFSDDGASEENVTVLWKRFDINFDKRKGSCHSPLKISFINGHSFKIQNFCVQSKELLVREYCHELILSSKFMDKISKSPSVSLYFPLIPSFKFPIHEAFIFLNHRWQNYLFCPSSKVYIQGKVGGATQETITLA